MLLLLLFFFVFVFCLLFVLNVCLFVLYCLFFLVHLFCALFLFLFFFFGFLQNIRCIYNLEDNLLYIFAYVNAAIHVSGTGVWTGSRIICTINLLAD